jgi:thioesterase domain-containing protein
MTRTERAAIDELANALASAAPLTTALRQGIGDQIETAVRLEAAVDRAVKAIRQLQPRGKERVR